MWREWKIYMSSETLSTWIEGGVFSKFWVSPLFCSSEQFFEEFFPNIIYHFFSLWPFFSTHSSLSFLALSCVLFGKNWENDDQLSPLFVTNVICAKVRNGYWPLENFQTKKLPLNVFSRVLGSCPALEKNDGDEDMRWCLEKGDLTPKQLVKLLMMLAFRAHLRWHLMVIAAKNLNRKMSSVTCRFIILQRIGIFAG